MHTCIYISQLSYSTSYNYIFAVILFSTPGRTASLTRFSVTSICSGNHDRSLASSSGETTPSSARSILATAFPQSQAWTIPSPEKAADIHSAPAWALRASSPRPVTDAPTFPTHGSPSALNPIFPVHIILTAGLSLGTAPQFSRENTALIAPERWISQYRLSSESVAMPRSSIPLPFPCAKPPPNIISLFDDGPLGSCVR